MKIVTQWTFVRSMAALVVAAVLMSTVLVGCSPPPEKAAGPKQDQPQQNVSESPASPTRPEEPAMLPEVPAKPEQLAAPPEPPAAKPEEPAAKPSEPAAGDGAGAAASVKVSAFAPADDLANQLDEYVKDMEKAVESEQEFKDSEGKVAKEANTLIVIALALGLHDQPNRYKDNALAIVVNGQELAAVADKYEAAKERVGVLKAVVEGKGSSTFTTRPLKWEQVAAIADLMKQVPLVNTKLKRYVQGSRFKSKAKDSAGFSAVIAAIGQASIADTSETKNEEEVKQWQGFCVEMRDAAGGVNAVIHAGDQSACDAAMAKLAQSCDDCHAVFHKGEKSEKESP